MLYLGNWKSEAQLHSEVVGGGSGRARACSKARGL